MFYGTVKVHKVNNPLRPIVSTIGSATYNVSKLLSEILRPYAQQADSYVQNTKDFLEALKDIHIADNEVMVSCGVKSLFTSVPTDDAKQTIRGLLESDAHLNEKTKLSAKTVMDLLDLSLSTRNFQFRQKHYELTDGLPMGAPASPTIANIFMMSFERKALESFRERPKAWLRYVDDIFSIIKRSAVNDLLIHLNNQHTSVQFTLEIERDGKLPFMDVTVHRAGNELKTNVYQNPHTQVDT